LPIYESAYMRGDDLRVRTKQFALAIIKLVDGQPNNRVGWTFTGQIVRSATSVAANYRAACRAKSDKDFIAKLQIVIEEADETLFWLEMIDESNLMAHVNEIKVLMNEANALVSIFVASVKTVRNRIDNKNN